MTISPQTLALFDAQTPTQVDSLLAQTALNLTHGAAWAGPGPAGPNRVEGGPGRPEPG